jgi:hypothetical protein
MLFAPGLYPHPCPSPADGRGNMILVVIPLENGIQGRNGVGEVFLCKWSCCFLLVCTPTHVPPPLTGEGKWCRLSSRPAFAVAASRRQVKNGIQDREGDVHSAHAELSRSMSGRFGLASIQLSATPRRCSVYRSVSGATYFAEDREFQV